MAHLKPSIRRNFGKISFEGPYSAGWVGAVKNIVPIRDRELEKNNVWLFDPRYYAAVLHITKHYFGNEIIDSTGGVAEPQTSAWKEQFDVWINVEEKLYGKGKYRNEEWYREGQDKNRQNERPRQRPQAFDSYAMLYVTPEAPPEVIRAAYRVLAQMHHPDKGGDTERMKLINAAHDTLKKQGKV